MMKEDLAHFATTKYDNTKILCDQQQSSFQDSKLIFT